MTFLGNVEITMTRRHEPNSINMNSSRVFARLTLQIKTSNPSRTYLYIDFLSLCRLITGELHTMAQPISSMMQGLSIGDPSSPTPRPRPGASGQQQQQQQQKPQQQSRVPPVLQRYMNPGLTRPPNTGLAALSSSHAESIRGPLFKIAGVNQPPPQGSSSSSSSQYQYGKPAPTTTTAHGSPKTKLSLTKHTAHGLHGPAHSTTSRALSSALNPHATGHPGTSAATAASSSSSKGGIGKYDGGLEEVVVNSEAAKVLELESG
jgi:aurora kinase